LPAAFAGCEGKDVVLAFTDQQGQPRTWRGDWRANVDFAASVGVSPTGSSNR